MIPLLIGWENRHPLLRYGSAAKMKEPPSSKQNTHRILLAAGCIGLLLTLIPACLSISGRDCMLSDNRIVSYNALNRPSEIYTDFSSLTIRTSSTDALKSHLFRCGYNNRGWHTLYFYQQRFQRFRFGT